MLIKYLIHQCGKVASQTIENLIRSSVDGSVRVERHHYLSEKGLAQLTSVLTLPGASKDQAHGFECQLTAARLVRRDIVLQEPRTIWVLVGIRDPLKQAISAFFQNLPTYCPWIDYDHSQVERSSDRLINFFKENFGTMMSRQPPSTFQDALIQLKIRGPRPWFEEEFSEFYNLDPYSIRLGCEQPFIVFRNDKFKFLIYRTEMLPSYLSRIMQEVGVDPIGKLALSNTAAQKEYFHIYVSFLAKFAPSSLMTDYYYHNCQYYKHFYSGSTKTLTRKNIFGMKALRVFGASV